MKKKYEKVRSLVSRFIENLRNAVWIRKEAEKVRVEQSHMDHVKDMYTKNLLARKDKKSMDRIPDSFLKFNKRETLNFECIINLTQHHKL